MYISLSKIEEAAIRRLAKQNGSKASPFVRDLLLCAVAHLHDCAHSDPYSRMLECPSCLLKVADRLHELKVVDPFNERP